MEFVIYHDPTSKTDKPAFIIAIHKPNKEEGRKKHTADLLVCDVPNNFIAKNVGEGKNERQFTVN